MLLLGLTGGSGAGKTTVLQTWAGLGAFTVDADETYHRLLREDVKLLEAIRTYFPEAFVSGSLDRKTLGRVVFASPERRRELESLTHGAVITAVELALDNARRQGYKTAAVEALYLLETIPRQSFTVIIGILAPLAERIERVSARDGVSCEYAAARIAAQPDDAYYREHCDIILENIAGKEELVKRAEETHRLIIRNSEFGIRNSELLYIKCAQMNRIPN